VIGFLRKFAPTHFAQSVRPAHDGRFHLFEARRGRGKSYTMAYWVLVCARQKVPVLANFSINHRWLALELCNAGTFKSLSAAEAWVSANVRYVDSWDQVMLAYDCLIILDEVNRLFDNQDRGKDGVPKVVYEWLQQSRKHKNTLIFAAQSMDWLTTRVRQLFDVLWRARKEMDKSGKRIVAFWLYGGDPWAKGLSADVIRNADYKMKVPFDKKIFRLYDTLEIIKAIPNESEYARFWDVERHMLDVGLKPPPVEPPKAIVYPEWWDGRAAPAPSACAPGWVQLGRHSVPRSDPLGSPENGLAAD